MKTPNLCLGTAQFGLHYGITNALGQVSEAEVFSILRLASKAGINYLDTAQAYGSAEQVVGRCVLQNDCFQFISKLPAFSPMNSWEPNFQRTLQSLGTERLDAFLLHRSADLLGPNGQNLVTWLSSLLDRRLVRRIGVSIYDSSELTHLPLDLIKIVQLPLSVYDQRMLRDGTIDRLRSSGVSVHARSLFLQGLLLKPISHWPDFLSKEFRLHHSKFENYLRNSGFTPLDVVFSFARSCPSLETLLFGVLSVDELEDIITSWNNSFTSTVCDFDSWSWHNHSDLDPRGWP